jgi:hypothetical protein
MVTFFIILFLLVALNIALLVFSALDAGQRVSQLTKRISEASTVDIFPFDLLPNKYKKAI